MGADQLPLTLLPLNLAKSAPQAPGFSYGEGVKARTATDKHPSLPGANLFL